MLSVHEQGPCLTEVEATHARYEDMFANVTRAVALVYVQNEYRRCRVVVRADNKVWDLRVGGHAAKAWLALAARRVAGSLARWLAEDKDNILILILMDMARTVTLVLVVTQRRRRVGTQPLFGLAQNGSVAAETGPTLGSDG